MQGIKKPRKKHAKEGEVKTLLAGAMEPISVSTSATHLQAAKLKFREIYYISTSLTRSRGKAGGTFMIAFACIVVFNYPLS